MTKKKKDTKTVTFTSTSMPTATPPPVAEGIKHEVKINRVNDKTIHGGIIYIGDNPTMVQSGDYTMTGDMKAKVKVLENGVNFIGTSQNASKGIFNIVLVKV